MGISGSGLIQWAHGYCFQMKKRIENGRIERLEKLGDETRRRSCESAGESLLSVFHSQPLEIMTAFSEK